MKERRSMQHRNDARPDLARRKFLGGIGSMALLGGAFGSVLTTPFARGAPQAASFAGGSVGLELDGAFAGYVRGATGGDPVFDISAVPTGTATADKSIGSRHSMPLELDTSGSMSAGFYSWVAAFTAGQAATHNGALVQFDANRNPVRRLAFTDASIVAVSMPPLDGSSLDRLTLSVTIQPQSSSMDLSAKGPTAPVLLQEKILMANAFVLQIRDLEKFTPNVRRIEGIGVKALAGPKGISVDAGTLRLSIQDSSAAPFYQWFDQCGGKECIERPGVIQLKSRDGLTQIGAIELVNLGITRVSPAWSAGGVDKVPLVTVDLYCEQQRMNFAGMAFA